MGTATADSWVADPTTIEDDGLGIIGRGIASGGAKCSGQKVMKGSRTALN